MSRKKKQTEIADTKPVPREDDPERFIKKAISYNDGQDIKAYVPVKERLRYLKFHNVRYDFTTESEFLYQIMTWRVKGILVIHPSDNRLGAFKMESAGIFPGIFHGESAVRFRTGIKAIELAHTGALGRALAAAGILIDDEISSYDEIVAAKDYTPDKEPTIAQKITTEAKKYIKPGEKQVPAPQAGPGRPKKI